MAVDPLLVPLIGLWRGEGTGEFPGMPAFLYREEMRFEDFGAADVAYVQRAWDAASGNVLHAETGIWRVTQDGVLVATISQARRTEVSEGTIGPGGIILASTATGSSTDVAPVRASWRRYQIDGDTLSYEYAMATGDMTDPEQHLAGTLQRVADAAPSV